MKNKLLRSLSLCLLLALLAGAVLPGYAAAKPSIQKETMWVGAPKWCPILLDWPDDAEIISIKSSDPSVVKVGKQKGFSLYGLWMKPLKVGKSVITIRYKLNGKTYSMKQTMAVRKYPNPIASLNVNGKKVSLASHKFLVEYKKYNRKNFTITFKLNKDWEVEGLNGAYWIGDDIIDAIHWKKGKSYKLPAKYDRACVAIDMRNKKSGAFFNYEIWFYR